MSKLKFIRPGLITTVQDMGRHGYQSLGMPTAGAADPYALALANALVGNDINTAAIEATLQGPTITVDTDCAFAVTGADMSPTLNGCAIELNRAYIAKAGDTIALAGAKCGCRSYVAFSGGVGGSLVMGSRSTYMKAAIGGIDGRRAKKDDELELINPTANLKNMALRRAEGEIILNYSSPAVLRATLGPQDDYFTEEGLNTLFSSVYTLSAESDRMGCRLSGQSVEFAPGKTGNIVSDAVAFGSVQIPSGQPIIMMADHQTTGGYPKPCCVIRADLPLAAQLKAGDTLSFKRVSVKEAQNEYRRQMAALYDFIKKLEADENKNIWRFEINVGNKNFSVSVQERL